MGSINFQKEAGFQKDGCPPVKKTPDLFAVVECVDSSQWHLRPGFSALTPMNGTFLGLVPKIQFLSGFIKYEFCQEYSYLVKYCLAG